MAEPGLLLRGNSYVDQAQQSEMKKIMTAELKQEDPTQESLENRVNGMKVARSEKDLEGFEDDGEDDGWIDAVQQTTEQANARACSPRGSQPASARRRVSRPAKRSPHLALVCDSLAQSSACSLRWAQLVPAGVTL
jgi:hypothetical protein